MDGREALRTFLEQRREFGDRELVLDHLTRAEAVSLAAGAAATGAHAQAEPAKRPSSGTAVVAGRPAPGRSAPRGPAALPATAAPVPPPAERWESLEAIAASVAGCTRCVLHKTATNAVVGEGDPAADMMFVGEAPGETEDQTGRPFVGRAGQLLTRIIEALGLRRDQVFICNVLKHRPPGNRNPSPEEVRVCSPFLVRQIELVKPRVIVALGTFAAQTLLETKAPIGRLRGQVHRYQGVPLVVTYHPAALLRNPAWKRPTWEDVQLAHRILESSVATDGA